MTYEYKHFSIMVFLFSNQVMNGMLSNYYIAEIMWILLISFKYKYIINL